MNGVVTLKIGHATRRKKKNHLVTLVTKEVGIVIKIPSVLKTEQDLKTLPFY